MRKQQIFDFRRFWGLIRQIHSIDPIELKESLVRQITSGETDDLKLLRKEEYVKLCRMVENMVLGDNEINLLKQKRSGALKRMQRLGIDTTNWTDVDRFCENPKIAGKRFCALDASELSLLIRKLEAIRKSDQEVKSVHWSHATVVVTPKQGVKS